MIEYALWIITGEVGVSESAYFFGMALSFPIMLELFDEQDGIRYLVNAVTGYLAVENPSLEMREGARLSLSAIRQYFWSHLSLVVETLKRKQGLDYVYKHMNKQCRIVSKSLLEDYRSVVESNYEDFISLIQPKGSNQYSAWVPIERFMELNGLQAIGEFAEKLEKPEIVSSCFDIAQIVALCPHTNMDIIASKRRIVEDSTPFSFVSFILRVILQRLQLATQEVEKLNHFCDHVSHSMIGLRNSLQHDR
jgi:hypothetical protein